MKKLKSIVVAGGCFWGLEHLLSKFKGVVDTEAGYAGGDLIDPTYNEVKTGTTGHAESVKITFDTEVVSLQEVLHYFFKIHNPTTVNQQGNDKGTQYRSTIFIENKEDQRIAKEVINEVNALATFSDPVRTTLEMDKVFYSAEKYHQKYLEKNPGGYSCHFERS
ncbi:peptide-methionine (S)-S-oxide reductase [Candidatus Aerophobetes bacterium]|uniref:Peptide methionine sulfoxide reductase MsrA n=1 Tax=Aerophobetes bacterium TaxID=2030807 RepID=A0A2A4X125_UNCAE|nr:MAG: peptide-methionine (S)-S-oxide reductase [Candidatus Aerophobetes bacterium]